jgi:rod shape-determining protein MreC
MLDLIKRNRLLVTACAVLAMLVTVLTLRWSRPGSARWVDEIVFALAYPFEVGYQKTTSGVSSAVQHYLFLVNLRQENDRLKGQVQALQEQLNHYANSSIQFNLLREQLGFLEHTPDKKVFAEVIGESADNVHHVLLINRGQQAGIRRNFPVVLREGVVGRIQSTSALQSVVELIVDRRHRFPVIIQRSRERLSAQGQGGQVELQGQDRGMISGTGASLTLDRVRMLADVQPGDKVITSGLDGIFPKGLLVGTVTQVNKERHDLFQTADVLPTVDFSKLEGVFVIVRDRRSPDYPLFTDP